jgi:hypothetical protein
LAPYTGTIERRVITNATWDVYGPGVVPPLIVHRYHGSPFDSPTGRGNHPTWTLNWQFGGFDYPCSKVPDPVPGKPGYYYVETGKFYHSLDRPVLSPYVYGGYAPNLWCHWVVRENVKTAWRDISLYEFNRTTMTGPVVKENLPRVKTREEATLDMRGECVDGCISAQDGVPIAGRPSPYLDTAYSAGLSKSYLYSRDPEYTTYTLSGKGANDVLVGNPADLTAQTLGISSRNEVSNYVYVLGINQLNQWLKDKNAPADMMLASLTDLAVSDQWWQTGGIVYAYDRSRSKVTKFVRLEATNNTRDVEEIIADINGVLPDSIGVDGFGHLFMIRTTHSPDNKTDGTSPEFIPSQNYKTEHTWTQPSPYRRKFRAYFRQGVYKSVYKRDYYSGAVTKMPGDVWIGNNEFIRDFWSTTDNPGNLTSWVWWDKQYQIGTPVTTQFRTELAVINGPTPPEVSSKVALADIAGPYITDKDGNLLKATADANGFFERDTDYFFQVENAPIFDANGVNINQGGGDKDGDTRVGSFPTTVKESTLRYFWKIVQKKDGDGATVDKVHLDQEFNNPILLAMLPEGEYKIGVKVLYKFYDYEKLVPGDLASKKEGCLSTERTATGEDTENYSWFYFKVKWVPPTITPDKTARILSGKPNVGGGYTYRPTRAEDSNLQVPPPSKFVIRENVADWSFTVRDTNYHLNKSVDQISMLYDDNNPPDPGDISMETGSLKWNDAQPKFVWDAELWRGTERLVYRSVTKVNTHTIYGADIKALFPLPSQPATYSLRVNGTRQYEYWVQKPIIEYVGGKAITRRVRDRRVKTLGIEANEVVYVTDETKPAMTFTDPLAGGTFPGFFTNQEVLWGTTGEGLTQTESPPSDNPSHLEYVVVDNNPFGNMVGANFTDLHGNSTHHNHLDRLASFSYTTAKFGTMPNAGLESQYSSATGGNVAASDLDEAAFKALTFITSPATKYSKCFSYRRYRIALTDLKHFSKDRTNAWSAAMDLERSTSAAGYSNLNYGLAWREAGGVGTAPVMLGHIVIRDNDRPNCFVKVNDTKNPDSFYYSPSNVQLSYFTSGWTRFAGPGNPTEPLHNGVQDWNSTQISGFDSFAVQNVATYVANILANNNVPMEIETDIPVAFQPLAFDNSGGVRILAFGLRAADGKSLPNVPDRLNGESVRNMFREAGDYQLFLHVEDNAKDWPSLANAKTNPTSGSLLPNVRKLTCKFPVFHTKLEVRVLDRSRH